MSMLLTRLDRKRRAAYIIVGLVLFLLMSDSGHVFASGGSEAAKNIEDIADKIIKFASRGWIFFAIVAGKLMTNDFVYGEFLRLDVNLRQLRQVMRSFANFALGFIFVAYVLKSFFSDSGLLKSKLPMIIVSAILIQASRFIMAVVIDLSTIGVAAVSSLPLQVLEEQRNSQKYSFQIYEKTYIDQSFSIDMENTEKTKENLKERELEDILPKADSVSGPLIFLGASVLHTLDYNFLTQEKVDWGATAVIILLKALVLIMFFIPIVALVIINMMRIFWIWLWVVVSPWIVLDYFLLDKKLAGKSKIFDVGSVLGLIFQPVAVVGLLSVGLVLIIGMASIITGDNDFDNTKESFQQQLNYKVISDNTSQVGDPDIGVAYVRGTLFDSSKEYVGGFLGQMILFIFVVLLLRAIIKAANGVSDITKSTVDSFYSFSEGLMKSAPIVPYRGGTSIGAIEQGKDEYTRQLNNATIGKWQSSEAERRGEFLSKVSGTPQRDVKAKDMEEIQHEVSRVVGTGERSGQEKLTKFVSALRSVLKKNPDLKVSYGSSRRFTTLLNGIVQNPDIMATLAKNNIIDASKIDSYKSTPAELMGERAFASFISHALETGTIDRSKKTGVSGLSGKVFTIGQSAT